MLFTVTRTGNIAVPVTVDYSVTGIGGDAADAADFDGGALPTGSVTFGVGEFSKEVTVNVAGDTIAEADESFRVTLSNPTVPADLSGQITADGLIQNDDSITLSIGASNAAQAEGNTADITGLTFIATRNGDTSGTTTVDFTVASSGATPATADDFENGMLPAGMITFGPGRNRKGHHC